MTVRRPPIRSALLALAACALALGTAATASADPTRLSLEGHRQVRIDDQPDADARLYASPAGALPQLLVVSAKLPKPVLVSAAERSAVPVEPATVVPDPEDPETVTIDGPLPATRSPIAIDGVNLRFMLEGHRIVVEPRTPLTGDLQPAQILAYMPEYRRNMAAYQPRTGEMRLLESLKTPVDIDIFFGTWCPHCEQLVPRLLRVQQMLKTPNLRLHFHGVSNRFDTEPLAKQFDVKRVPTGVVRRGDTVVSRMEGEQFERPESALSATLFGDAS